jgi:hypothetical protein
MITNPASLAQ